MRNLHTEVLRIEIIPPELNSEDAKRMYDDAFTWFKRLRTTGIILMNSKDTSISTITSLESKIFPIRTVFFKL